MKKIIAILMAAMMLLSLLTACGSKNNIAEDIAAAPEAPAEKPEETPEEVPEDTEEETPEDTEEEAPEETPDISGEAAGGLQEILAGIYAITAPEFPTMEVPFEMSDADSLMYFTGLSDASLITEAVVSEAAMGSQAYSLVLVRAADPAKTGDIAEAMKQGIDPRKWICVEADDIRCVAAGDIVMFVMISSEYAETITADGVVDAFCQTTGMELDIE